MRSAGAVASLLLAVFAADAEACQRCGLFGRLCRFQSVAHHVAVAPAVAYQTPPVFVVQNNYPQPNGAAGLLAQQGATVYGYQAAASAYLVNPAEVLRQAAELSKAATATASLGLTGYSSTAQTALALQAGIVEPMVRGHAAAQVLEAAGLARQSAAAPQSFALRVTRTPAGQWAVESVEPAEAAAAAGVAPLEAVPPAPPAPTQSNGVSILATKCAQCHGLSLAQPKAGLYFDAGHTVDCATVLKAIRAVKTDTMPKGGTLTPQEKGQILDELLALEGQ